MGDRWEEQCTSFRERKLCRVILEIITRDDDDDLYCPGGTRETEAFDRGEKTQS